MLQVPASINSLSTPCAADAYVNVGYDWGTSGSQYNTFSSTSVLACYQACLADNNCYGCECPLVPLTPATAADAHAPMPPALWQSFLTSVFVMDNHRLGRADCTLCRGSGFGLWRGLQPGGAHLKFLHAQCSDPPLQLPCSPACCPQKPASGSGYIGSGSCTAGTVRAGVQARGRWGVKTTRLKQ